MSPTSWICLFSGEPKTLKHIRAEMFDIVYARLQIHFLIMHLLLALISDALK